MTAPSSAPVDARTLLAPFWGGDARVASLVAGRLVDGTGETVTVADPASGRALLTYADAGEAVVAAAAAAGGSMSGVIPAIAQREVSQARL